MKNKRRLKRRLGAAAASLLLGVVVYLLVSFVFTDISGSLRISAALAAFAAVSGYTVIGLLYKKKNKRVYIQALINTVVVGVSALYFTNLAFNKDNLPDLTLRIVVIFLAFSGLIYIIMYLFSEAVFSKVSLAEIKKHIPQYMPAMLSLLFILGVYLPYDTYMGSYNEYDFNNAIMLLIVFLTFLAGLGAVFFAIQLPEKVLKYIAVICSALTVCIYFQYMFLNINLGLIDGSKPLWDEHIVFGIIDLFIWIACFALIILCYTEIKRARRFVSKWLPAVIGGMQLVSIILMVFAAPKESWQIDTMYLSGEEQYMVASDRNLIVFVWDAADNKYVEKITKENPDFFEPFKDFTIYTDTCSVYDSTAVSMTQMFTGMDFDNTLTAQQFYDKAWYGERASQFYNRMHAAGYKINFFNMEYGGAQRMKGKIDNVLSLDKAGVRKYSHKFRYGYIAAFFYNVSLYRALPYLCKRYVDINRYDKEKMKAEDTEYYTTYSNNDFNNALKLEKMPESRAFIMQHCEGTHNGDSLEHCLMITAEYMRQMKALGVYDNADIIITSDHGEHNPMDKSVAATPVFMIKRANESSDKVRYTTAPMYFTDLLATFLTCVGQYEQKEDEELFGTSIYAYNEGDIMERTWYDRAFSKEYPRVNDAEKPELKRTIFYNIYNAYTYKGNTEELKRKVEKEKAAKICPMKEYYG